eukprot:5550952-Amphidinium_carterae.4
MGLGLSLVLPSLAVEFGYKMRFSQTNGRMSAHVVKIPQRKGEMAFVHAVGVNLPVRYPVMHVHESKVSWPETWEGVEPLALKEFIFEPQNVSIFQLDTPDGPALKDVQFRTTVDLTTGMILEDKVRVVGKSEDWLYRALLHKLMKIQSTFVYARHDDDPDWVHHEQDSQEVLELDVRDVCVRICLHSSSYFPADPRCPICRLAKATRKPARTRRAEAAVKHRLTNQIVLVVLDEYTNLVVGFVLQSRTQEQVCHALLEFGWGNRILAPWVVYSDADIQMRHASNLPLLIGM